MAARNQKVLPPTTSWQSVFAYQYVCSDEIHIKQCKWILGRFVFKNLRLRKRNIGCLIRTIEGTGGAHLFVTQRELVLLLLPSRHAYVEVRCGCSKPWLELDQLSAIDLPNIRGGGRGGAAMIRICFAHILLIKLRYSSTHFILKNQHALQNLSPKNSDKCWHLYGSKSRRKEAAGVVQYACSKCSLFN